MPIKKKARASKPKREDAERLAAALEFLEDHERTCLQTVETWMLRSLPVPRKVLEAVMADDAWAKVLRDAWVVPVTDTIDVEAGGFYRGTDPKKGIGVVDRAGETGWLDAELVMIPHPVLLDETDDLRGLAIEIGVTQGLAQLFRETFTTKPDGNEVDQFANGAFGMLSQAIGLAKRLGFRVAGGAAVCRVLERGKLVEARYEIGDGDPMSETQTGALSWVDDKQRPLAIADVPPVAFSEGMRMASMIYAKRQLEKASDE